MGECEGVCVWVSVWVVCVCGWSGWVSNKCSSNHLESHVRLSKAN